MAEALDPRNHYAIHVANRGWARFRLGFFPRVPDEICMPDGGGFMVYANDKTQGLAAWSDGYTQDGAFDPEGFAAAPTWQTDEGVAARRAFWLQHEPLPATGTRLGAYALLRTHEVLGPNPDALATITDTAHELRVAHVSDDAGLERPVFVYTKQLRVERLVRVAAGLVVLEPDIAFTRSPHIVNSHDELGEHTRYIQRIAEETVEHYLSD